MQRGQLLSSITFAASALLEIAQDSSQVSGDSEQIALSLLQDVNLFVACRRSGAC